MTPFALREEEWPRRIVNDVWGGGSASRLSTNLRLENGWTYNASSAVDTIANSVTFQFRSRINTDNTLDAVREMIKEVDAVNAETPISADELVKSVTPIIKASPNEIGTNQGVLFELQTADEVGTPYDEIERLEGKLSALTVSDMKTAANKLVNKNDLIWTFVGDLSTFEEELRAMNVGDI